MSRDNFQERVVFLHSEFQGLNSGHQDCVVSLVSFYCSDKRLGMWRPKEEDVKCLPLLLSTLFLEADSFNEPKSHCFG